MGRPDSIPDRGAGNRNPNQARPGLRRERTMEDIGGDNAGNARCLSWLRPEPHPEERERERLVLEHIARMSARIGAGMTRRALTNGHGRRATSRPVVRRIFKKLLITNGRGDGLVMSC